LFIYYIFIYIFKNDSWKHLKYFVSLFGCSCKMDYARWPLFIPFIWNFNEL